MRQPALKENPNVGPLRLYGKPRRKNPVPTIWDTTTTTHPIYERCVDILKNYIYDNNKEHSIWKCFSWILSCSIYKLVVCRMYLKNPYIATKTQTFTRCHTYFYMSFFIIQQDQGTLYDIVFQEIAFEILSGAFMFGQASIQQFVPYKLCDVYHYIQQIALRRHPLKTHIPIWPIISPFPCNTVSCGVISVVSRVLYQVSACNHHSSMHIWVRMTLEENKRRNNGWGIPLVLWSCVYYNLLNLVLSESPHCTGSHPMGTAWIRRGNHWYWHIQPETKWSVFYRRHFQINFLEWNLYFDSNFIEICFQWSSQ